ncbi:MAG: trigger factor [Gemmatimonadaceae bacterium]
MDITITPTETSGISRRMQISIPVATVSDFEERAAKKYATQARLPGFRPGKAPAGMVRKRFAEAIRQEAIEALLNEAYREAVEREGLKLATQPHVHDLKAEPGQPLEFELHCEVRPEVTLEKTDGFTVERREAPVNDETIGEQIEKLREQKADWAPITEEKAAPGDMVSVALSTADENGELPAGREYKLVMGGGQAIAGIEELVMEAMPGETLERNVQWPDDFPDESQRGQRKMVRVTVNDIKRKALPALDDAFAREMGDFDNLAALREAVRTDMTDHARREADSEVRGRLLEQIIEANPFDVPNSWVKQLVDGYAQMYQVPEAEKDRFAQEFRSMAERQVRRDLIIDALAEREKLTASSADVDARIEEIAKAQNAEPGQVYAQLQKSGRLTEVERELTESRVFAWLLERNPVTAA